MRKTAKVLVVQWKQLELLSQHKVTAWIAWEEEAWRASEAGEGAMSSGIVGNGKGKALEKRICMNCLRKGVECEWDEGGRGKSKILFFFLTLLKMPIGKSCQL